MPEFDVTVSFTVSMEQAFTVPAETAAEAELEVLKLLSTGKLQYNQDDAWYVDLVDYDVVDSVQI